MASVLSVNNITKFYGKIQALNNVSFSIPEGSVFGILGPNGSGKTTLLGIVMDVLKATSGTYLFFGNVGSAQMRRQVGTLLETPNFYHYLTGQQNLAIAAQIKGSGTQNIEAVLKKVDLFNRRNSKFSTFSLGMKQRLAIAAALLADPKVLVLDEPTNGLDPVGIAEIRALIKQLAAEGKTIIMASHLLDEVEKVCTHVAVLKYGTLLVAGPVDEVLINEDIVEVAAADNAKLQSALQSFNGYSTLKLQPNHIELYFAANTPDLEAINRHCFNQGIILKHLQLKKKSLETKFFELTNN